MGKSNIRPEYELTNDNIQEYLDSIDHDIVELYINGYQHLTIIPDISRFTKLKCIQFHRNHLTQLPELNDTIIDISVWMNHIRELPKLPSQLIYLRCSNNELSTLPELPLTLQNISISYNHFTILPEIKHFPNLKSFVCDSNLLTILPELPDSLLHLSCAHNLLTKLPKLPMILEVLSCNHNLLTELPELNHDLEQLYCPHNQLKYLPKLNKHLYSINCCHNELVELPEFNDKLRELHASYNDLITIPSFKDGLTYPYYNSQGFRLGPSINLGNNYICKLPMFNSSRGYLDSCIIISNNPIYNELKKRHSELAGDSGTLKSSLNLIHDHMHDILYRFGSLFYSLKYKKKFIKWMYGKLREERIQFEMHPSNINVEEILNN